MKQTRSALTMLLNAYKSVFKSAWLKGAASAVILTAGLATGASAAADEQQGALTEATINKDKTANYYIIGTSGDAGSANWENIQISGSGVTGFTGNITVQSGEATDNYVSGSSLTGTGSLSIVANGKQSGAMTVEASASKAATVNLGKITVSGGSLAIEANSKNSASVKGDTIDISGVNSSVTLNAVNGAESGDAVLGRKGEKNLADSVITLSDGATITMASGSATTVGGTHSGANIITGAALNIEDPGVDDSHHTLVQVSGTAASYGEINTTELNINAVKGGILTAEAEFANNLAINSERLKITAGGLEAQSGSTITITSPDGKVNGKDAQLITAEHGTIVVNLNSYDTKGKVTSEWSDGYKAGLLEVQSGNVDTTGKIKVLHGTLRIGEAVNLYTTKACGSDNDQGAIGVNGGLSSNESATKGNTATLQISETKLAEYLNGGIALDKTDPDTKTDKGNLQVKSGGIVDFGEIVTLSDFNFNTSKTSGSITVNTNEGAGNFKADTVVVEHALATNIIDADGDTQAFYNDDGKKNSSINKYTSGAEININAKNLVLGAVSLHAAESADIELGDVKASESIKFVTDAKTPVDEANDVYTGFQLATKVKGDAKHEVIDENGKSSWVADAGTIEGAVRVQQGGEINILNGNFVAQDKVTLYSGGEIKVGGNDADVNVTDATLTLNKALELKLDKQSAPASKITVNGGLNGEYSAEDKDKLTQLDLTSGINMVGSGDKSVLQAKATITATSGGIVLLSADSVNDILDQNTDKSGAGFVANSGGKFVVNGGISTDKYESFGGNDTGFMLANGGILEAPALSVVVDETPTTGVVVEETDGTYKLSNEAQGTLKLAGTVRVDDFTFSDHTQTKAKTNGKKDAGDSPYVSQITLESGTVEIANSLNSDNYRLVLGKGNSDATLVFSTELGTDAGTISNNGNSLREIRVDNGSVKVENGKWTAASTEFILSSGSSVSGNLTVGDNFDSDANGNTYQASLTAAKVTVDNANSTVKVAENGTLTVNAVDFEKAGAGKITVAGDMIIKGDADAKIQSGGESVDDPANGVKFSTTSGSIKIENNGKLTFEDLATEAVFKDSTTAYTNVSGSEATVAVNKGVVKGYSKIANEGGELQIALDSGTSFSADSIIALKRALLTDGSFDGNVLKNGGVLNIGQADFDGIKVNETEIGGVAGYTAAWKDLKDFSDVYGNDVTNEKLVKTNVTDIALSDKIQGHYGSLSMDKTVTSATSAVSIAGDTTLRFADGNNGYFVSNADHSAAYGAEVDQDKTLTLIGGGEIGAVYLNEGSAAKTERSATVLRVQDGDTVIASIEGKDDGSHTYVDLRSNTTVKGDIEDIDMLDAGAALTAQNISGVNELAVVRNGSLTAKTVEAKESEFYAGDSSADKLTIAYANDNEHKSHMGILNSASVTVKDLVVAKNGNSNNDVATIEVGADLTEEDLAELSADYSIEKATGTGYLSAETVALNGATLYVDPAYGEATSIAALGKFSDADATVANDIGKVNGTLVVGKNAALALGTASIEEVADAIAQYQKGNSLTADNYGSILYLNGQVKLGASDSIALNSDADVKGSGEAREGALKYTVNNVEHYADLGLGENTAILMTEKAFEDKDGKKTGTAMYFDKDAAVVNGLGGDIVLAGSFDTSDKLNIFNDNGKDGVDVNGSIKVVTQNGFLFTTLEGEDQGLGVQLEVDKDKAYQIMNQASNPVVETLIAYGNRNVKVVADEEQTNEDPAEPSEPVVNTAGGANVVVGTETVTEEPSAPAEPEKPAAPAAKVSSSFLDAVITTTHGAPAETAARMAVYGGSVEAVMAAASTSSDAIAARMGMGNQNSVLTYADNADGAGIWLAPVYKHHESDGFGAQGVDYGADIDLYGLSLGADYTFAQGFRAGAMFNVGSGDADGQGAGSAVSNDFDYWGISVYGGYSYEDFSVIADIGYTTVDNDLDAASGMEGFGKLTASTDTESWTVGVTAQYKLSTDYVDITPHIGARFTRIDMDNYSVNSAAGKIADFSADSMNVFSIPVGVSFSSELTTDSGWKVMPALDLTVTANTGDDEFDGDVAWTGTNLTTATSTEVLDDVTYGVNLGLSAEYNSFSFGLGVNYVGSDNTDEYGVQANARFTF